MGILEIIADEAKKEGLKQGQRKAKESNTAFATYESFNPGDSQTGKSSG